MSTVTNTYQRRWIPPTVCSFAGLFFCLVVIFQPAATRAWPIPRNVIAVDDTRTPSAGGTRKERNKFRGSTQKMKSDKRRPRGTNEKHNVHSLRSSCSPQIYFFLADFFYFVYSTCFLRILTCGSLANWKWSAVWHSKLGDGSVTVTDRTFICSFREIFLACPSIQWVFKSQ